MKKLLELMLAVGLLCGVASADPPVVNVKIEPGHVRTISGYHVVFDVILASESGVVPIGAADILIEWDTSVASLPAGASRSTSRSPADAESAMAGPALQRLELVSVHPLGNWFLSGFLPDPDGINDDLTDGQVLYTFLGVLPGGYPEVATPDGMVVLRLKFKVRDTGAVEIVPEAGEYGATRVFAYEPPNFEITGTNAYAAMAHICCGC